MLLDGQMQDGHSGARGDQRRMEEERSEIVHDYASFHSRYGVSMMKELYEQQPQLFGIL